MKIKKIFLILLTVFCLVGCTNLNDLSYNDIINKLSTTKKNANVFRKGFKFYIPNGLQLTDASTNYAIMKSSKAKYYLYVDLVSYNEKKDFTYEKNTNAMYSELISYDGKKGYANIILWENNQYLIEIVYNYAKIEVMVEESFINEALINSINILNSISYDDIVIENLLKEDNLTYTEEIFDMFHEVKENSNTLNYIESEEETENDTEIIDTDFIN